MQSFSPTRQSLAAEHFFVIVIGGGINGVAIARECARAGRRTLIIEQHDFAAGTTSRATRIIHGGLRYLEHGELGLVRESLRERQMLLRERPHLVHPLHFLLTLGPHSRRSALSIRLGLWLYRQLGGAVLGLDRSETDEHKLERLLDSGQKWSIFNFEDAQCEFPERLVAEWLVEAMEAGAQARNHTEVLAVDVRHGRSTGVLLRDRLTGKEDRVEATWVVNATGPWADRVCQRSHVRTGHPMIGGVRGSHIVIPRFAGVPDAAIYTEALDGRPIFVLPWNDQVLVGTTEVADHGDPGKTAPAAEEIDYLLSSLLKLFPGLKMSLADIRYSFAGVRPLPFSPKGDFAGVSRKHYLHDHSDEGAVHMISVIGGKLTTASELARQCAAKLGIAAQPAARPVVIGESDDDRVFDSWVNEMAKAGGLNEHSARSIVEWHGSRSLTIAQSAAGSAELRAPLCSHTPHIVAEAVDALAAECAVTLGDILLRRVPVALGPCWSQACSREATARLSVVLGWDDRQAAAELEAFESERAGFLRRPGREKALQPAAD